MIIAHHNHIEGYLRLAEAVHKGLDIRLPAADHNIHYIEQIMHLNI